MNIVFFGSPSFAIPTLEVLAKQPDFNIIGVVTQPDKPAGRGLQLMPTPIKTIALAQGFTVSEQLPTSEQLIAQNIDAIVVVAYGKFIPPEIVHGWPCINLHPSLLPKYRGPSPMQATLLNGDTEAGITTMLLGEGMDDGDILLQEKFTLDVNTTISELHDRCARDGATLILKTLQSNLAAIRQPQDDSRAIICKKTKNEDSAIQPTDTAFMIHNKVRAITAYTMHNGLRVKILKTKWANNQLTIETVQPEGKKPMAYAEFVRGYGTLAL